MSRIYKISIRAPLMAIDAVIDFYEKINIQNVSWFECDDSLASEVLDDNGFHIASEFIIQGYSRTFLDENVIKAQVELFKFIEPNFNFIPQIEVIQERDWVSHVNHLHQPIEIGKFFIYAQECDVPSHLIPINIKAATAFGSGDHPTTQGCLEALSALSSITHPHKILDMGCGSGILTIACKKLWSNAHVEGVDNEENAISVSQENAITNNVEVNFYVSYGFENPLSHKFYDVIVANILAKPLCIMASEMYERIKSEGFIILSGLLERQRKEVLEIYTTCGFNHDSSILIDGWSTLVLKRRHRGKNV